MPLLFMGNINQYLYTSKPNTIGEMKKNILMEITCQEEHSRSRDTSVGIVTDYGLEYQGIRVRFLAATKVSLPSAACRPALVSIQPLIQWVPGSTFPRG
jgi:hypothetical protein